MSKIEELKMQFLPLELSNPAEEDTEFIPLMTNEEEDAIHSKKIPEALPILPLRNTVLFPGVVIPITVGRDKSIALIKESYKGDRTIGVVSQKNDTVEEPNFEDLNKVGTVAHIIKMLRMPDGNTTAIIQGKRRFTLTEITQTDPYMRGEVSSILEPKLEETEELEATINAMKELAMEIIQLSPNLPSEASIA